MATEEVVSVDAEQDAPAAEYDKIYHLGFNQDFSCLMVGTDRGYKIFSWEDRDNIKVVCDNEVGDVILAERLFSSSLMAIVSMKNPRNMKLSHLRKNQQICDYVFGKSVLGVQLTRKRIVVCLEHKIIIHAVADLKVNHEIDSTPGNPKGLFAGSTSEANTLIAYPGSKTEGLVQIFNAVNMEPHTLLRAHESPIAALAFDEAGTKLATASEKGTVIRIFDVRNNEKIQELRRGIKRNAAINSLTFALNATVLVVSSNTPTIHIFKISSPSRAAATAEDGSVMGWFSSAVTTSATYLPGSMTDIFQQERAFATATLPFENLKCATAVTLIDKKPVLLAAATDGFLHMYDLDLVKGGECPRIKQIRLDYPYSAPSPVSEMTNYARAVKGVDQSEPLTETEQIREVTDAVHCLDVGSLADQDDEFPPF